jgi:DNA-binding CsgD family transcriptional regulator
MHATIRVLLCLITFIALPFLGKTQLTKVDSLEAVLVKTRNSSDKIDLLLELIPMIRSDLEKNLEYCNKAIQIAKEIGDEEREMKARNWLAGFYVQHNNLEKAFECIEPIVDFWESKGDSLNLATIHGNIGVLFTQKGNFEKARDYTNKSYQYLKKINDTLGLGNSYKNWAYFYEAQSQYDSAMYFAKKAVMVFSQLNRDRQAAHWMVSIGFYQYHLGNYELAIPQFHRGRALYKKLNSGENDRVMFGLAQIHFKIASYDSSRYWAEKGLNEMLLANSPYNIHSQSLNLYKLDSIAGDFESAAEHLQRAWQYSDTLKLQASDFKLEYLEAEFRNEKKVLELREAENQLKIVEAEQKIEQEKASKQQLFWISLAIVLVLLLLFALVLISRQRLRLKAKKAEAGIKALQLEKAEAAKAHLEEEVAQKNRELTSFALANAEKIELLNRIKDKIEDNSNENKLIELKSLVKDQILGANEWVEFKNKFEAVHPDFTKKLLNLGPKLTTNDVKICILLKLGMSSKQIAALTNISPKSVDMNRYRIRNKLGLDTSKNLQDYILTI